MLRVVYFDQLSGAARTQKLVETYNSGLQASMHPPKGKRKESAMREKERAGSTKGKGGLYKKLQISTLPPNWPRSGVTFHFHHKWKKQDKKCKKRKINQNRGSTSILLLLALLLLLLAFTFLHCPDTF